MINVSLIKNNITVSCLDKDFLTIFNEEKYEKLLKIQEDSLSVKNKEELNSLLKEVELICTNDFKTVVESFTKELVVNPITKETFLKIEDKVSEIPLPISIVERIKTSIDKKEDYNPLIKCWIRFLSNPILKQKLEISKETGLKFIENFANYINKTYVIPHTRDKLISEQGLSLDLANELSTVYEVKITKEGLLQLFKTSTEIDYKFEKGENEEIKRVPRYSKRFDPDTGEVLGDTRTDIPAEQRLFEPFIQGQSGDAFYCEGSNGWSEPKHFIRIGHLHRLSDWSQVNTNDDSSCVKGLHVGSLAYITNWGNECTDIHCVFVDPAKIGAICKYSSDSAIRVLEYFVYASLVALNHSIYHSSEYGKLSLTEWADLKEKAVSLTIK